MDDIGDIVQAVIGQMAASQPLEQNILRVWEELLSTEEKKHAKIDKIHKGQLDIKVDSSAWLYQFKLKKEFLQKQIHQRIPEIDNIYLKLGTMKNE
jgi:hypothetical protein